MKIKMKIKTLIFITFILTLTFIWAIPTATLMIAGYFEYKGSEKASLFYEKYAAYPTTPNIEGNYIYANSLIKGFNKYMIFFTGSSGGENTSPENIDKAQQILKEIMTLKPVKNSEKEFYIKSYKMILDIAIASGDAEMLQEWIDFGQKGNEEKLIYTADIYKGFLYHVNGESERTKKIIEKYENTDLRDMSLDVLKAEIALYEGKYQEAKMMYESLYKNNWRALRSNFGSNSYDRSDWLDRYMENFNGDNAIKGTVTYEGKPMPFMEIYVQEANGGLSFYTRGESYVAITDINGEFQTLGLKDGIYNVGIGVDGSLLANRILQHSTNKYVEVNEVEGEIHFEFKDTLSINSPKPGDKLLGEEFTVSWQEVEGAAYYTVNPVIFFEPYGNKTGNFRTVAVDKTGKERFTETKAEFNIRTFRNNPNFVTHDHESFYLGAQAVLGIFLPEVEYPIVVNAYDEGNTLITSSLSLRSYFDQFPSITVEGSLTEGEKLIYNKNYPEAIEFYENILKENPDHIDALRYLTRIYGIGWKEGEKNLERAFELGKRYTDISGNRELLINTLDMMDMHEIKENKENVYRALTEAMKSPDFNDYYFLSRYYIAVGNYDKAREVLNNSENVSEKLVFLNMYFGDYMEAAKSIQSDSFYISILSSNKVKGALTALSENPPKGDELGIFNDFLLKLITGIPYEEGKNIYDETVRQISNSNIKIILDEIYLENHWYTEY